MTNEDKLYADKLRNKALSDYERLNLAINELEATEQARGMTREQAINYLKSSGMSEEQIETVINALTCDDCISRTEALKHSHIEYDDDGVGHKVVYAEDLEELPSVQPQRKHGKWKWELASNGWVNHICSECGFTKNTDIHIRINYQYCPKCGAEMRGDSDVD